MITTIGTNCSSRWTTRASGRDIRGKLRLCTREAFLVIDCAPEVKQLEKNSKKNTPITRNRMNWSGRLLDPRRMPKIVP